MIKRKTKKRAEPEHSFPTIILNKYTIAVNTCINHKIKDKKRRDGDTRVYDWGTRLELYGRCTYPEAFQDDSYYFTIHGSPDQESEFSARLKDCHVVENWREVYHTVKGELEPVYDVPDGLPGYIELQCRPKLWRGCLFLLPEVVNDMIMLLSHHCPKYIDLHLLRRERRYRIVGFTLQTSNPDEDLLSELCSS